MYICILFIFIIYNSNLFINCVIICVYTCRNILIDCLTAVYPGCLHSSLSFNFILRVTFNLKQCSLFRIFAQTDQRTTLWVVLHHKTELFRIYKIVPEFHVSLSIVRWEPVSLWTHKRTRCMDIVLLHEQLFMCDHMTNYK